MTISNALKLGASRVARVRSLVVLFYAVNLVAAAIVVAPMAWMIGQSLGRSLESDRQFANFDPAWIPEMLLEHGSTPFTGMLVMAGLVGACFLLVQTYLAGGAIAMLERPDRTFFSSAARLFPRLFRLFLLSLVCYAVVLALSGGIGRLLTKLSETSMEAKPWIIAGWGRRLLLLFLFGTVNLLFDYAKIACVREGAGAWRGMLRGFRFVFTHAGRTMGVYWICAAAGLVILAAYHGLSETFGQNSRPSVILVLVMRQIYMLVRSWLRMWTWGAELSLCDPLPEPAAAFEPPPLPPAQPEAEPEPEPVAAVRSEAEPPAPTE